MNLQPTDVDLKGRTEVARQRSRHRLQSLACVHAWPLISCDLARSSLYAGEIPLAVLGAWAVTTMQAILPYAMGFAAGAMLYVISDEIIPETHRKGHERAATMGLLLGTLVMLYLDVTLG